MVWGEVCFGNIADAYSVRPIVGQQAAAERIYFAVQHVGPSDGFSGQVKATYSAK